MGCGAVVDDCPHQTHFDSSSSLSANDNGMQASQMNNHVAVKCSRQRVLARPNLIAGLPTLLHSESNTHVQAR